MAETDQRSRAVSPAALMLTACLNPIWILAAAAVFGGLGLV